MSLSIANVLGRAAAALALALAFGGAACAQEGAAASQAAAGPPAGFVAPADPKPDDTNFQRSKSQPGNNAPMWRAVRESGAQQGVTQAEGIEAGTLIQSFTQYPGSLYTTAGEAWRQARNHWIIPYGGALLLLVVVSIGVFYWRVGPLGGHEPDTGRVIERFTVFERTAHAANAVAFVVLAISGIVMAWGKFFLLPVIGGTLFGWLTYALKTAHNFAGPLFAVSLIVVILAFVRDNLPRAGDMAWLAKAGGLLSKHEVPSHRFNAGEKLVFWIGVFALGLIVVVAGLVLDKVIPGIEYTRSTMQIANMVHGVAAALMMALFAGHIYIGTIGMKGALDGMRTGYVDEAWAKEHHELWYDDIKAGKILAQRTPDTP
jgi:formate dehydrogenase subunit gamma